MNNYRFLCVLVGTFLSFCNVVCGNVIHMPPNSDIIYQDPIQDTCLFISIDIQEEIFIYQTPQQPEFQFNIGNVNTSDNLASLPGFLEGPIQCETLRYDNNMSFDPRDRRGYAFQSNSLGYNPSFINAMGARFTKMLEADKKNAVQTETPRKDGEYLETNASSFPIWVDNNQITQMCTAKKNWSDRYAKQIKQDLIDRQELSDSKVVRKKDGKTCFTTSNREISDLYISRVKLYNIFLDHLELSEGNAEQHELIMLGISYLKHFQQACDEASLKECRQCHDRAASIVRHIQYQNTCKEKHYTFDEHAIKWLMAEDMINYRSGKGNFVQLRLHDEFFDILKASSDLHRSYGDDPFVANFIDLSLISVDQSRMCSEQGSYKQAFALSDYAESMCDAGKHWAQLVEKGIWGLYKAAAVTTKGVMRGGLQARAIDAGMQLVCNPKGTISDFFNAFDKLVERGTRAIVLLQKDPKAFKERSKQLAGHAIRSLQDNAEEIIVNGIGLVAEPMGLGIGSIIGKMATCKHITKLKEVAARGARSANTMLQNVSQAVAQNENFQKVVNPVSKSMQVMLEKTKVQVFSTVVNGVTRSMEYTFYQLQKKFNHAKDFGISKTYNKDNVEKFAEKLCNHIKDVQTKIIQGTYRGDPAIHYFNEITKLNVTTDLGRQFISGWQLGEGQIKCVLQSGSLR